MDTKHRTHFTTRRMAIISAIGLTFVSGCMEQGLGLDNTPIESVEWQSESTLSVTFSEEHDSDFIALVHENDDTIIWYGETPRFSGPIEIPVQMAIACDDADYPTRTFQLVVGRGAIGPGINAVEEIIGRRDLTVESEWLEETQNIDASRADCFTVNT